ncbi:hypothetical protein ABPG75_013443 [Micractinium tetrahymenae]
MVKAYLRYELTGSWGVIASATCNICYDRSGKHLLAGALENVAVWNVKQAALVRTLVPPSSQSGKVAGEVTQIAASPTANQVAVGHADGTIRLWDLDSGEVAATFSGHRKEVSALRFSRSGALLASGSKDTDVVVWDVAAEAGLYRLRGHRGQVTDLAFVEGRRGGRRLVSASKDEHVKVWDLDTQHCCQTVVGHRGEVWSLDVDPSETRLATGCADSELRVFAINAGDEEEEQGAGQGSAAAAEAAAGEDGEEGHRPQQPGQAAAAAASRGADFLVPMGSVRRQATDRAETVRYASVPGAHGGVLLTCQSAGKVTEVFRVRSAAEAARKMKRRRRRKREKAEKKARAGEGEEEAAAAAAAAGGEDDDRLTAGDELELVAAIRSKHKARSFAVCPPAAAGRRAGAGGHVASLVLSLTNNSLELWDVTDGGAAAAGGGGEAAAAAAGAAGTAASGSAEKAQTLDLAGHRSDIRALALASDDSLCLSASNNSVKVWNPRSGACLRTMDSGYGLCALFAPGNRHAIAGTKEGTIEIFDVGTSSRIAVVNAHTGPVWSLAALPDSSGFVSGSADHDIKFWEWGVAADPDTGAKQLAVNHTRTLKMTDDVLCVRVSPNGKLLAASLLDSTVRVFFVDSLKFFLSLYGHKLPVLSMDISSDSTLLVTGSADKNIKIWGLDFGDCHRSLFAHADSVMAVAFVPNTHYLFTAGKDKLVKYWDADKFEHLLTLEGHHAEVWCLAVGSLGDLVLSGSHDRSLRRWERTEEPFFIEEEKEKRLESLFEADLEAADRAPLGQEQPGEEGAVGAAGRKTLETVTAADDIIEALDLAAEEDERMKEFEEDKARNPKAKPPAPNPLLLGQPPSAYVLRVVGRVRSAELEQALLLLPFTDALRLIRYLVAWLRQGVQVELLCRVATLLLRLHMQQLMGTPAARPLLLDLQQLLHARVQELKDVMGFNLAAMNHLQRGLRERQGQPAAGDAVAAAAAVLPLKRKAAAR